MSEAFPPPPAYEEVRKTSSNPNASSNWQAWFKKLTALNFNQDEVTEYTKLFVSNDVDISMIPELNDGVLKSIGIEKAGHRIRILRLQKKPSTGPSSQPAAIAQPTVNVPRCAWHPNVVANEKCRNCGRLLCLNCRREKSHDGGVRYYCQNCYQECTIL